MKKQLAGVIRLNAKQKVWNDNDVVQKLIKILIFDFYMLFIALFRLFCKAMSKEGCSILKILIAYVAK